MPWEPFEIWPGGVHAGGAFRGASEPVVAERRSASVLERTRVWWASSPDFPFGASAGRMVLTQSNLYIETLGGEKRRVPRARLEGARRQGGRIIVGVRGAADLVFPHRGRDGVQGALMRQLGYRAANRVELRQSNGVALAVLPAAISTVLFVEYPFTSMLRHWALGLYTSEMSLGTYGALALALLALAMVMWMPSRVHIDGLGVERRRGLVPWLPYHRAAARFRSVEVREIRYGRSGRNRALHTFEVVLHFKGRERFGSLFPDGSLSLQSFTVPARSAPATTRVRAELVAERVATALGLRWS